MKKIKIKTQMPWIAYPGSTVQQNYAEDLRHGYLEWNISDAKNFSVLFKDLPNPKPYITLNWNGNVDNIISIASTHPRGSRFRIKSDLHVNQQDIHNISSFLRKLGASEITFKIDHQVDKKVVSAGSQTLTKTDLRNIDALLGLIKGYHNNSNIPSETWQLVSDQVKNYLSTSSSNEEVIRNTKWSLRSLKFDNVFTYGEGNVINFQNLNGVVGIFGPNRAGKSSIVGTIMYSLFNSSDRGSIKNLYVCNIRKPYCYTNAIVNVNGIDYVFERQTTKHESKKGVVSAPTSLNVYRINELGEAIDLAGEQRNDTEKVIKSLIGNADDFLLTSLSAQGEINHFISHGSTKRRQILSKFLDLDIFDKMYDLANKDVNVVKAQLKSIPEKEWDVIKNNIEESISKIDESLTQINFDNNELVTQISELKSQLTKHTNTTPVTESTVNDQKTKISILSRQSEDLNKKIILISENIQKITSKIDSIESLKTENDIVDMKRRLDALVELENTVLGLKHVHEKELSILKQHEKSLKLLDDVPCDDKFPNCKFIKDAHLAKTKVDPQRKIVNSSLESLNKISDSLNALREEGLRDKLEKMQKLYDVQSRLNVELSNQKIELVKLENSHNKILQSLEEANQKLIDLEEALKNNENSEVVSLRTKIEEYSRAIERLDKQKMSLASERGKALSDIQKLTEEKNKRDSLCDGVKSVELIANAFSKKGIPSDIVTSQLPLINGEISKILAGIVDFTVELEVDVDSDWMDIYINYGDSRRIIELASGMEKMISSIAIRVALINISTLPKTDMFIIDEGFGALDDAGVEACNRLLTSLKRYFKTIFVITHVDGVKDVADHVIEISKNEKDARVIYDA